MSLEKSFKKLRSKQEKDELKKLREEVAALRKNIRLALSKLEITDPEDTTGIKQYLILDA